ncbi:MAG: amidohydrolase [Planctomyces sp.]|nr:amidohydrolase [Planctomyces sp.]
MVVAACCSSLEVFHRGVAQEAEATAESVEILQQASIRSIESRRERTWELAQQIWAAAEPGYQESKSSSLLSDELERSGFRVQRGVAGMPTAFIAEFGSGEPVLGILGEFDALPGLSQTADPEPVTRSDQNSYGHGCGHHLFGAASLSAAVAISEQIRNGGLSGTVRFYGCPAEEGGSAKVFMVRDGLFADCATVLHWHPSSQNAAGDRSSLARIAVKFQFFGKAAHAAGSPEQGRSALDAVELTNFATELLREHTPEDTRIHHVITAGGDAPNVVPAFAEVYYYIRHPEAGILKPLYERLERCARAGALATETELKIVYEGGIREILPNQTLSEVVARHLNRLNDLSYTPEEFQFAARLQTHLPNSVPIESIRNVDQVSGTVGKGSTDVGDVSWVVPTTGFSTACWVPGTPGHSWQAVACGGTTIGEKGMHLAARTLAVVGCEILSSSELRKIANAEFQRRRSGHAYEPLIPEGMAPPLEYRNSTQNENKLQR